MSDVNGHGPGSSPEQAIDLSMSVCSHALCLLHPREGAVDRVCRVGGGRSHHPLLPRGQALPTPQTVTFEP